MNKEAALDGGAAFDCASEGCLWWPLFTFLAMFVRGL
jgi:hypothetical protein